MSKEAFEKDADRDGAAPSGSPPPSLVCPNCGGADVLVLTFNAGHFPRARCRGCKYRAVLRAFLKETDV